MGIKSLANKNILNMLPYTTTHRSVIKNKIFLDANENAFSSLVSFNLQRYPDIKQRDLKNLLAKQKHLSTQNIHLSNGSNDALDSIIRVFCIPSKDNIIINEPAFSLYENLAQVNHIRVKKVMLTKDFQIDVTKVLHSVDSKSKLIFICSPNNPTGNLMLRESIIEILKFFKGIVVLDEAYIDFSSNVSLISLINQFENLIVVQSFSKGYGLAGLRLGVVYANNTVIELLNNVKVPFNIGTLVQKISIEAIKKHNLFCKNIFKIKQEREKLACSLRNNSFVVKVYKSDSNFLLVKFKNSGNIYEHLIRQNIIVRNCLGMPLCKNCLRITIGTANQNKKLITALKNISKL
jgi:histidinol-phosphate aminotransferase